MKIEKWLSNVYYDECGTHIWNKEKDGGNQLVAEIRGWGRLQNEFKTEKEAAKFQDEVGEFIVQAIREKIAISTKTIEKTSIDWVCEQIEQYILTYGNLPFNVLNNLKKQAKLLEKQEIKTSADFWNGSEIPKPIFEEYYNNVFKK